MLRKELNTRVFAHRDSPETIRRLTRNNDFSNLLLDFMDSGELARVLGEGTPPTLPYHLFIRDVLLREGICTGEEIDSFGDYLARCTREIPPSLVRDNPYVRSVRFPVGKSLGGWRFSLGEALPYEPFICDDILVLEEDLMEVPQVGWCRERLTYPLVEQDGREWMAVKPSEIISMAPSIEAVSGDVLVLGLGLGYFPFMASLRDGVRSLSIVERDPDAIALFGELLLPQFPCPSKIRLIEADALDYLPTIREGMYDWAFVDLWHDGGDGAMLYARCRSLEKPFLRYLYWMDETLQSALRWRVVFG